MESSQFLLGKDDSTSASWKNDPLEVKIMTAYNCAILRFNFIKGQQIWNRQSKLACRTPAASYKFVQSWNAEIFPWYLRLCTYIICFKMMGWVEKWTLAVYAAGQTAPCSTLVDIGVNTAEKVFHLRQRQGKHCGKRQIYCQYNFCSDYLTQGCIYKLRLELFITH